MYLATYLLLLLYNCFASFCKVTIVDEEIIFSMWKYSKSHRATIISDIQLLACRLFASLLNCFQHFILSEPDSRITTQV